MGLFDFRLQRGLSQNVDTRGDVFEKQVPSAYAQMIEAVERAAGELGRTSQLFSVPAVLSCHTTNNEGRSVLTYSRIADLTCTAFLLDQNPRNVTLLTSVGRALGTIHKEMNIPEENQYFEDGRKAGSVCIHGDFTPLNTGLSGDALYIWDWIPSSMWNRYFNMAPPEFDLATFVFSLMMTGRSFTNSAWYLRRWLKSFFSGYVERVDGPICRGRLTMRILSYSKERAFFLLKNRCTLSAFANYVMGWYCALTVLTIRGIINDKQRNK